MHAGLPVTPFHYPLAYAIYKLGGRLSLPGIVVGSMLPDLEIPFMILLFGTQTPNRMALHSLLGNVTVGTTLAMLVTILVYPRLIPAIFRVSKFKVKEKCRFTSCLALSCLLGGLSHVLLDVTNHAYNPILWPFLALNETPSPIVPALGGVETASLLMHGLLVTLFVGLFFNKRENFWERLLVE